MPSPGERAHARAGDSSLDGVFADARGAAGYDSVVRAAAERALARMTDRAAAGKYVSRLDVDERMRSSKCGKKRSRACRGFGATAPGLALLLVDPGWDNVRGDARFAAALRQLGFAERSSIA